MVLRYRSEDASLDEHQDEQSHCTHLTLEDLQPPRSLSEAYRDRWLSLLDRPVFQGIGLLVLVLIIADGAFFFFLLMGWQAMCRPRTDCDPRNWWYNWSIQLLNVLFSYQAVITLPWRTANFLHLSGCSCPQRNHHPGLNLYGMSDTNLWFHIPVRPRLGITLLLLGNCIAQLINQGTRFFFYSHERQASSPGNIWTNVFFAAAFAFAGVAALWQGYEAARVRSQHPPGTFGPGPKDTLKNIWKKCCRQKNRLMKRKKSQETTNEFDSASAEHSAAIHASVGAGSVVAAETENDIAYDAAAAMEPPNNSLRAEHVHQHQHDNHDDPSLFADPTRDPQLRHILPSDNRAGLRLWGI